MLAGLQPHSTPELLDLAVRLVRARFWPLVGLMALLTLPTVGLQAIGFSLSITPALGSFSDAPPALGSGALLGGLLQNLGNLLQAVLLQGLAPLVVTQAMADELNGERQSLGATLRRVASRWADVLVLLVLIVVVIIGLFVWWLFVPILGWVTGGGGIVFFSNVVAPAALVVLIVERCPAREALTRAWFLLRDRFWGALGLVVGAQLLVQLSLLGLTAVLSAGLIWLLTLVQSAFGTLPQVATVSLGIGVVGLISTTLSGLLAIPVNMAAILAFYRDTRIRREGLDLATRASVDPRWPAIIPPPRDPASPFFRGRDLGDWLLLTLAFIGLVVGLYASVFGLIAVLVIAAGEAR